MKSFLCPFPWTIPCVTTSGTFRVCPVSQSSQTKGLLNTGDQKGLRLQARLSSLEIRNSESLKELRRQMMSGGDVSSTCDRCLNEEANGIISRRQLELHKFSEFNESFVEAWTKKDGSLREGAPTWMVILRLGNKCNLVCRMCGPSSSSAWYKEWQANRHKGYIEDGQRVAIVQKAPGFFVAQPDVYNWTEDESVLDFIKTCGADLKRLHFSGGEPLLSHAHLEILKHLVKTGQAEKISLEYNTNLSVLSDEMLSLWSHFQFVELGISADGPPALNEYIRYPIKTERFLANLHKLDQSQVRGRFWIATTVQTYNVLYLKELAEWILEQKFKKIHNQISWHVLRSPKELSLFALPVGIKKKVAEQLSGTEFASIGEIIFSRDESAAWPEFLESTQKMDKFRGQTWEAFAKLKTLLLSV